MTVAMSVITSNQSNLASGRIAAAHGRFRRIRQMAPMYTPTNTWFLGPTIVHIKTASRSVQPLLHRSRQSLEFTKAAPFPFKTVPSHGDLDPI